jgi:hypothetical protein
MKQGKIRPQKTHGAIDRCECRLFGAAGEQTGVIQLEVRSAMNSIAADIHKVHVAGHGQCQFTAMVLSPCRSKSLGNRTDSGFIGPGLSVN